MADKPDYSLPKQTNYETSLAMAKKTLSKMDFEAQCEKAGLKVTDGGAELDFLGRPFSVDRSTLEVRPIGGGDAEMWEKIIVLHYLINADGAGLDGSLITYKQVPDGAPYYEVFNRRTAGILLSVFGDRLPALVETAKKVGAREVEGHGDMAFAIRALPRVEYIFVCYEGDEEFPPEIRVIFDSSVMRYLPAEDITVLCQMACITIVRSQ